MKALERRLARGEVILLDGATGTELERRGVPMDCAAWSAAALVTHPDEVRRVHEDYIGAGVDVITANSFSTARHQLEPAGLADRCRELNQSAVALARQARERAASSKRIYVAASISSVHFEREYMVSAERAASNFREQAEALAEAGPDLIMMEMMWDIDFSSCAVEAAVATGLPVWVGFTARMENSTVMLFSENYSGTLESALPPVLSRGGSLVNVMHTEARDVAAALSVVKDYWPGPVGAYGHSGRFVMPHWQFNDVISPEGYLREAEKWVAMGAQVIGGCCGIGPAHIRLLNDRLPEEIPPARR